jgi:hypothetical protein
MAPREAFPEHGADILLDTICSFLHFGAAQFLGAKTFEARDEERKEEQKVIEARIREREVGVGMKMYQPEFVGLSSQPPHCSSLPQP